MRGAVKELACQGVLQSVERVFFALVPIFLRVSFSFLWGGTFTIMYN